MFNELCKWWKLDEEEFGLFAEDGSWKN